MAKTWNDLSQLPEFQNLSREEQERARGIFFDTQIAPQVDGASLPKARALYDEKTLNRTWGEVATDTGKQLLEGGVNIINAIPSLVAPEWSGTKALDSAAQGLQDWQSPTMKAKIANANALIEKAGKEGLTAQAEEALLQYLKDPALASRLVTTNIASVIPGLGSAKLAQAASLARSAKAAGVAVDALGAAEKAKAAKMALLAGGVTNSALNAGGARGEAYKDLYDTAIQQGYSEDDAQRIALEKSRLPAVVGAVTGAPAGMSGLESGLFGRVAGKSAIGEGVKHFGTEVAGELAEEALPQVATNWQASEYDQRPLTKDIGRTLVETALATGPNATVAGVSAGLRREAAPPPETPPVGGAPVDGVAPAAPNPANPVTVDAATGETTPTPPASPVIVDAATDAATPAPIPVVGPLSEAAQAGQDAAAAGAHPLPQAPVVDPAIAQQEAEAEALKQQQQDALQQHDEQMRALKLRQEQLRVNQQEQKLGLGPTQFDEPALLSQANDLASKSLPTIDQPSQETSNALQDQTQGPSPTSEPAPAQDPLSLLGRTAPAPEVQGQSGATINPNFTDQQHVDALNTANDAINAQGGERLARPRVRLATPKDLHTSGRIARKLASTIATGFGHRVIYVASENPQETLTFDGAISPHDPTTIFLAHDSESPVNRVVSHEVLHGLRRIAPDVYTNMVSGLRQIYDPESVAKHAEKRGYLGGLTDANEEEWVADLFSNTLHTPKALSRLALAMDHKVLGSGLMFLNNVKAFINALHGRLLGSFHMQEADNALADLEAARDIVTLGIVNYSRYRLTGQTNEDLGTVPLSLRSSSAPAKIKNPPLESKNEVTDVYNRETVSARAPTAKGATENPVTQKLGIGLKTYLRAENLLPGAVETLSTYPQLRPTNRKVTLARRINDFINVIQSNLLWLHDKVPDTIRERSKLWYDGALKITERSSELYGVTKRQFAAVLATQSPQKDWFENVSLAERITSIFKRFQGHVWDARMTEASARVLKQEELAELSEDIGAELDVDAAPPTPSKFIAGKARGMVKRSNGGLTYEQALAKATEEQNAKNQENQARLDRIKGKRLDELYDDMDIAMWVRIFDTAHHSPHYSVVSPEGNFVGTRTGKTGSPTRIRWGTFAAVAKSISVLKDGSIENISQQLGAEHKIRNFYNNIIAPNDPAGYVTMDTHAIAADMVSPFSSNSEPVAHNFGVRGVPGSSVYGMSGTYPIHGEGYTRAAAERGVLPREMQSITWEAIRGLFTAPFKASKATGPNGVTHTAAINAMWGAYRNGSKTIDETRQEILDYVKKVTNRTEEEIFTPEWARSPSEVASKTSYEELHGMPKPAAPTNTAWSGMNVEVAPNPDQLKEAATDTLAKWSKLSDKERGQITELVGTPIIKQTMARLGISQYRIENTIGGFEKDANPSITIHFGPEVSWNQLEEATRVLGYLFKQKQMVLYDETDTTSKEDQVSFVQFKPTRKLSNEEIADLYVKVHAAFPDVGGMSVSNGSLSFANFSGTPDEEFGTKLRDVVHTYLKDKDYGVERINHRFRSVLLGDIVGQDAAGNDIIQTTLRGTRYDDETKTTEMGGEDGRSTIGKRSFTRGEALRWKRDFRDVQTSFDQRLEREVRHSYDRLRQESRAAKAAGLAAAPASLRSDAGGQERARGRTATQGSPVYGKATPGSVQGIGVHYSREERSSLDSGKFGTGIKGREAARVAAATDPRLRNRVYFYINDGKGIHPEQGLGGYAHTVNLQNLYDLDADPKYLAKQDANATESAILDAGYDGYVADFGAQRAAVLLGARQVPVRYVGRAITPEVPVGQRAVQNPIKQVASILKTPWQKRTPAAFGEMLKEKSPELYAQFGNQLTGTGDTYWPGDMARKLVTPDTVDATPADVAAWSQAVPMSIRTKPAPRKTVIAYKLFRLDPKRPGELFPLFVKMGNTAGIPMGIWQDAEEGEPSTTLGKVKSLLGPLAFRPGWHAGDLPIATHIGGERDKATGKPTVRLLNQVWAEVELAADVDWQAEANSRGKTARDKAITDPVPVDGFYRYKTNPNMTGNWLIGGSMKVNRLLSDAEVKRINDEAGTADLPRKEPLDLKKYGFDTEARFSNRSGLFLSPQRIDYEREARREGSDADRELVQSRLDSAVEEMGIEYPQKFSVMREEGPHFGLNLWRTGDAISTTKQGINNALSKGRGGASLYGQYAYPLYESEAAYLQRTGLRPFFADGGWWYDAVSTIQGAYMGHGGLKGLPQEIGVVLRRVDRRAPDVWEVEHMPRPRTDNEYPARKRGAPRFSNRQTKTPEFKKWFGDSKIVDAKGDPLVVYHGTPKDFSIFKATGGTVSTFLGSERVERHGFFTTPDLSFAEEFSDGRKPLSLYVRSVNPLDLRNGISSQDQSLMEGAGFNGRLFWNGTESWELFDGDTGEDFVSALKAAGFDGVWIMEPDKTRKPVPALVVLSPTQIKSATDNVGAFSSTNPDIRFSNRPNTPPEETRFRKAQRIVQDKFNRFRVIQDWLKKEGVNLTENADVYKAEERFHARVANQIEDFREQDLKPLIKRTQELQISMDDIAQFLHAQHAEERNDAVAKINPNFPDGGSGMDTAVARSILAAATPELRAIANEWRDITEKSLQMKVDSGLITQEMADAYHNKYQHYVPLKGGPEEQLVVGTGRGLKVRHKEKRALGHPLRQGGEWIIEQILEDREATIMKAEKALMAKHLLQMAVEMNRPDLISVEEPKKRQVLRQQNAYTVTYKGSPIETFQSLEAARVFRQFAGTQRGRSLIDFDIVKSTDPQVVLMASPMLADNETMAYVGGHEIRMQINDDLLARAYGNLGQEALGPILRAGRALNTYLSKAYTGYNPEFILTNMIRDFTTGIANLSGEQGVRVAGKAVKHYPRAFMDLLRSTRGPGHVSQSIQDYREDGGNTGAAYLDDLERIGTNVQQEYAKLQGILKNVHDRNFRGAASAAVGKTLKPFLGWIEKLNQASENAMRLAIYQAMREAGLGRVRAASAAKNTTVNFNRKGEMGQAVNAWWLFFNASVQGTAAIAHAHFKGEHKGQAWALSSTLVGIGYLASLAAASGGDDDEDKYEKLSDYERSRNLIIRTGDGFAKIPVPYGYGFMWNLGRTMADAQRTGKIDKAPWHLASNFAEEFTPFGSMVAGAQADSKQAVMFMGPTAWQAFAVPAFNLTSFGTPLYPEKSFQTAEFARDQMWRNTKGSWADEMAGLLEKAGLDVSPETLKHLWRTGTGGAGTFATSLFDLGQMGVRGVSDFDAREIPFVRKVWTVPGVAEARSRYYTAVDETKVAEETFKRYKKKGDFEKADTYREENDALISLAKLSENNAKRIKRARDLYDSVKLDPNMTLPEKRQALRELEIEETQIYDDFMRTFNERARIAPR